jgi:uncharacterized protein (TIGR03118 family)
MRITTCLIATYLLALCVGASAQTGSYTVTPIVDNTQDQYLINPWGLSRPINPGANENEWWASDNGTGYTTLYYANQSGIQSLAPLVITIPPALGTGTGSPTGTAFNPGVGPGPGNNNFTFVTLDGTIANWNAAQTPARPASDCAACHTTTATIMVNNSSKGASYTGLAINTNATTKATLYYAANNKGGVEAYDATTFAAVTLTGHFSDSSIPHNYRPYGIQAIGTRVWVTFYNGIAGGFVDSFDTNGKLKLRLASGFSEPWGVALAPATFGTFSNAILISNTTSGFIGAYNATTGAFEGYLKDSSGSAIVIPGIWAISFGNGNKDSGPTNTLYYTAGGVDEKTGVFGAITAN